MVQSEDSFDGGGGGGGGGGGLTDRSDRSNGTGGLGGSHNGDYGSHNDLQSLGSSLPGSLTGSTNDLVALGAREAGAGGGDKLRQTISYKEGIGKAVQVDIKLDPALKPLGFSTS